MAMTLRLSEERDRLLERLAEELKVSKNIAAAAAIEVASPRPNHEAFVAQATERLLVRDRELMARLANA